MPGGNSRSDTEIRLIDVGDAGCWQYRLLLGGLGACGAPSPV